MHGRRASSLRDGDVSTLAAGIDLFARAAASASRMPISLIAIIALYATAMLPWPRRVGDAVRGD